MTAPGYAGSILKIDLSSGSIAQVPTQDYSRFLGGRGFAAKVYWDEVPPGTNAFDAENTLTFATGPLTGLNPIGGSRWTVCGKSPQTIPEQFSYSNLGGSWGTRLKSAGYDGVVVRGKSEKPVYLVVDDGKAELKDASVLWGKGATETVKIMKHEWGRFSSVVTIGPAGENMAVMAVLLADNDATGSGGLGAVMGSKRLKAIVVNGSGRTAKVAQPEKLHEHIRYYRTLNRTSLPVEVADFLGRYSPEVPSLKSRMKKTSCRGCIGCYLRTGYETEDGRKGKFMCHLSMFYQPWELQYYGSWKEVSFDATQLCNDYGLDSKAMDKMLSWLDACRKGGILNDENTGIPLSKIGSREFIETLVKKVSFREGFGDVLAKGIENAAEVVGDGAKEHLKSLGYLSKAYYDLYGPRLYTSNALLHAMEPRDAMPQLHEIGAFIPKWVFWAVKTEGALVSSDVIRAIAKRFWGSELAVDFSTYDGKALAAKMVQDRSYVKESLVLCDILWPILDLEDTEDHVGDAGLESKILSAVTGKDVDEESLAVIGERIFNLQRAILVREGWKGRESDILPDYNFTVPFEYDYMNPEGLVPGQGGDIISRKGSVVDRDAFEKMKDEYYQLRAWDMTTGLQTRSKLEELGLKDIADDLEEKGLIA